MSFQSIEDQIKQEYNIVRAWIALHPYSTIGILVAVAWGFGRLGVPI